MSSLCKTFLLSALLMLSACGFQPMYGAKNQHALAAGVQIVTSSDARGQQLHKDLEDRLNPGGVVPPRPAYRIAVNMTAVPAPIGVARDGTVSRFNVTLYSDYILTRTSDGKEVGRGVVNHVSSYNNEANQYYSTYISERDAVSRGITELAELYRQRIGAMLLKDKL